jgi:RecJ-like exonuclease
MYCPECGKENQDDARFCMHCGADLSECKVQISPKIVVSPTMKVKTSTEKTEPMCAFCGEVKAVVICPKCGRMVCNYHFEDMCPHLEKNESSVSLTRGSEWRLEYGGLCTKCCITQIRASTVFIKAVNPCELERAMRKIGSEYSIEELVSFFAKLIEKLSDKLP